MPAGLRGFDLRWRQEVLVQLTLQLPVEVFGRLHMLLPRLACLFLILGLGTKRFAMSKSGSVSFPRGKFHRLVRSLAVGAFTSSGKRFGSSQISGKMRSAAAGRVKVVLAKTRPTIQRCRHHGCSSADLCGETLSELNAPLIEGVDVPNSTLHKGLVLIKRNQSSEVMRAQTLAKVCRWVGCRGCFDNLVVRRIGHSTSMSSYRASMTSRS